MSNLFRTFMGSSTRPWLRNDGSERLFTLKLKGVENPLDPDPYWEANYGGGSAIYDTSSESNTRRLKDALDAHRKLSAEKDQFDFPVEKMLVFSDVVMWLPSKVWSSSSREGGERLYMLSEKLKYRHRTDFGDELYKQRSPHYAIMPLNSLAMDEVVFQFGLGVYLPREEDIRTAEVKVLQQGKEPVALPNWQFFETPNGNERPSTLYAEQHFLLLGNTLAESAIQSPSWFSKKLGYIMVDTHREPNRIYGDDEYITAGKLSSIGDTSFCSFHTLDEGSKESIKLVIERHSNQAIASNKGQGASNAERSVNNTDTSDTTEHSNVDAGETVISTDNNDSASPLAGLTVISSDEDPIFHYRYFLSITGIILPRIAYAGIKYWILHINQQGMPAAKDENSQWMIRGNQHRLEWCEAENKNWQALDITTALPFPADNPLVCREAVIAKKQYAILLLPQPLASPLSHQSITLGRGEDNQISLQLLNRDDSIEWQRATRRKQSMGHLELSAKHLKLSIEGQSMALQQLSSSAPTYLLQDGMISQTLEPKSGSKVKLSSGAEIIVGNYLLQYQREYTHDNKV
ncbi:MAG TPA: hypothetical protein ENJ28_01870 [Gammaproteobacteria bacterium]|nr:hypothetical protein [Gammaproteobacteria bacterium]